MTMTSLLADYRDWIFDKMQANLPEHRGHDILLDHLNDRAFVAMHPLDENRVFDGKYLRREFLEDEGLGDDLFWDEEPSVLEVLASMSIRIETEIMGEVGNDHIERWFWIMIRNLGLDIYENDRYDGRKVDQILDIWLGKHYLSNGKKSIFPLKTTTIDQRDIDMWYQMQLYLAENYMI